MVDITIQPCKGVLISCLGTFSVSVIEGVAEIAGVALEDDDSNVFNLSEGRSLHVYSIEGARLHIGGDIGSLQITYHTHNMSGLVKTIRHKMCGISSSVKNVIACIGSENSGKHLAAATICNTLARNNREPPVLCDLSPKRSLVPFCLSCSDIPRELPLLEGTLWTAEIPFLSFFYGSSSMRAELIPLYLHCAIQCIDTALFLAKRRPGASVVFIIPYPEREEVPAEQFIAKIIALIAATHVVTVGADHSELRSALLRIMPTINYFSIGAIIESLPDGRPIIVNSPVLTAFSEYFYGNGNRILGAAKGMCKISSMRLYRLAVDSSSDECKAQPVAGRELKEGMFLALSQAKSPSEVPFANIFGLVVVLKICADEVILLLPSAEANLPSSVFLIGSSEMILDCGKLLDSEPI